MWKCGIAWIVAATSFAGTTWHVDDDGPADFPTITAAISAASDGDVILVAPGFYAGFSTSKSLSILGSAGGTPSIGSPIEIVQSARFSLAGFVTESIVATGVTGRLTLDACLVEGAIGAPAVRLSNCAQALLSRMTIVGGDRSLGLMVEASFATVSSSTIRGGDSGTPGFFPANGGPGVAVRAGSTCVIAASNVAGGDSGFNAASEPGIAGTGLRAESGTTTILRGGAQHVTQSGDDHPGPPGKAIDAAGTCKIVWSGVTFVGDLHSATSGNVVHAASQEPWLEVIGIDLPGQTRFIELFGASGENAVLFASLEPGNLPHASLEIPLWISPGSLVAVVALSTQGFANPISIPVPIPSAPSLAGIELHLQAVFPQLASTLAPGKFVVTNAACILPRS